MRETGRYERTTIAGEEVRAFIPHPLPPANPPLALDATLTGVLHRAESALSRLDLAAALVPSVDWFLYSFVRKEAVVSSQIEGTQATLIDLFTFEGAGESPAEAEVQEVCNYLDAFAFARSQIRSKKGLPLSLRLLNEAHRRLMRGVRGSQKQPGRIRRSQNWLGGTRPGNAAYVPPPPRELGGLLGAFESYLHADDELPPLVRAGLLHAQFETIHPYLDGNGRMGRLLVTLLLEHWRLLVEPLLYLSLFFKLHRTEYYRLLNEVRLSGDFESWLRFFLEGVVAIGEEALDTTRDLHALVAGDREKVLAAPAASVMGLRLLEMLPTYPIVTVARVTRLLHTTKPTAAKAVSLLVDMGVLKETSGRRRDRIFRYASYIARLRTGTEL